jgi:trehalose 2-sulfotransferase
MAPNPAPASIRNYPFFTPVEAQMLARANQWFADHFWPTITAATSTPTATADPVGKLLILCMTPRSGSTALSGALAASRMMGLGGERLNYNPLKKLIAATAPQSLLQMLCAVIDSSRSRKSGVAQIKCDLPQLLPFLVDPDCLAVLAQAQFVYLTREDVLGQAISRYRGAVTGHWHSTLSKVDQSVVPVALPDHPVPGKPGNSHEVPYNFSAIKGQIDQLTKMMAAYERVFAAFGLSPLRITYEQVTTDSYAVMARMAALLGVTLPADVSLADGGHIRTATGNNDDLRARYIADCRAALGRYGAGAGLGETAAAAVNAAT